jgi:hypothetical protein
MSREDHGSRTCADAGDWERSRDPGDSDGPDWSDVDSDGCTNRCEDCDKEDCDAREGCTGVDNKSPCSCSWCTQKREAARAELDAGRPDREE